MPTDREFRINEKIMGGCNHPDYVIEQEFCEGHQYEVAVCVSCGAREAIYSSNERHPLDVLKDKVQPHCLDMTMIRRVTRKLESEGWRLTMTRVDRTHQYFLSKGGLQFSGEPARNELEAICNVVDKLAKSR